VAAKEAEAEDLRARLDAVARAALALLSPAAAAATTTAASGTGGGAAAAAASGAGEGGLLGLRAAGLMEELRGRWEAVKPGIYIHLYAYNYACDYICHDWSG
jgi:hypothetical protein